MKNSTIASYAAVQRASLISFVAKAPVAWNGRKRVQTCRQRKGWWTCETIVVAGATGGVGRLVVERLLGLNKSVPRNRAFSEEYAVSEDGELTQNTKSSNSDFNLTRVIALVRDASRAKEVFPTRDDRLQIVGLQDAIAQPFTGERDRLGHLLSDVLAGATRMVICTGTTAFPTLAWRGGNTPNAVDNEFVRDLVNHVDENTIQRVVLVSSIGTSLERRCAFPFLILNAFGVLYSKAQGEQHLKEAAKRFGFSYGILHAGRLLGAPHTNIGVFKFALDPCKSEVAVAKGDSLQGDLTRTAAADAAFYLATWDTGSNFEFSAVHTEGYLPGVNRWLELLRSMEMPRQ